MMAEWMRSERRSERQTFLRIDRSKWVVGAGAGGGNQPAAVEGGHWNKTLVQQTLHPLNI